MTWAGRLEPERLPWTRQVLRLALALSWLLAPACSGSPPPTQGVVVERCQSSGAAAEAGLLPGDVLLSWSRPGAGGRLDAAPEARALETEQSPRGPVTIQYWRAGVTQAATLPRGEWELWVRPLLPEREASRYAEAARLAAEGELEPARALWDGLAREREGVGRTADALWIRLRLARAYAGARQAEAAERAFAAARDAVTDPGLRAAALDIEGESLGEAGRNAAAATALAEAATLREQLDPASPGRAWSLTALARVRYRLLDLDGAGAAARAARGLYADAEATALERSGLHEIQGSLAYYQGDLDGAEQRYREAVALREPLAPGSPRMAMLQASLGLVASGRGDLDIAERQFRRALAIDEGLDPRGVGVGYNLNFLGLAARDKGDFESARGYLERALEIFRAARPDGIEVAGMLNNLGGLALREGDLDGAERRHRESLALRERLVPDSLDVAASLNNIGSILRSRGRLAEARPLLERALALKQRVVPDSLILATTLAELGELSRGEGALAAAAAWHRRALAIRRAIAPHSDGVAESLYALGGLALQAGRAAEAEERWRSAVALVEQRRGRLAITTAERSRFAARFHDLYRELAELLARQGRAREAFDVVERARARALRALMAQRDFARSADVPAALVHERRRLEQALERSESRLARQSRNGSREIAAIHGRLGALRRELDAVEAQIRQSAPRLAQIEDPGAVTVEQVRAGLEPGTLLLSYAVGEQQTLLFAVGAERGGSELVVATLPVGRDELERRVDVFRALIERGRASAEVEPALLAQGRWLDALLIGPVEAALAGADRLVVVAEGPLLTLPFAALVRPAEPLAYLAQRKPLSHAASAGALIERARSRPAPTDRARSLVAFGDPDLPAASRGEARLGPLPFARQEAQRIAALFGASARVLVGSEASEQRARSLGLDAQLIHFATHARPDPRFPLDSALVLSPGAAGAADEAADGWLHAWEVAEALRLDADLVTLSGCETGLGRELRGEGLLGLARAFQYAGARAVLVSLWAVSDQSTAELMAGFYAGVERGLRIDEALREARRQLLDGPVLRDGAAIDARHPYHWAGFRLIGDAR